MIGFGEKPGLCFLLAFLWWHAALAAFGQESGEAADGNDEQVLIPLAFYTPETGVAGGVTLLQFFGSDRENPSSLQPLLIYTQKQQTLGILTGRYYAMDARLLNRFTLGYRRFPAVFYGIGSAAGDRDQEGYTPQEVSGRASLQIRLERSRIFAGPAVDRSAHKVVRTESGGVLQQGVLPGTEPVQVSGYGLLIDTDTRDNPFSTEFGYFSRLLYMTREGDLEWSELRFDMRRFYTLDPEHVLAYRLVWARVWGEAPFFRLPTPGGQNLLRGLPVGRFNDRFLGSGQLELRRPLRDEFTLAVFAGLAGVAPEPATWPGEKILTSGGVGLRYLLAKKRRIRVRFDIGVGEGYRGFYVNIMEAF